MDTKTLPSMADTALPLYVMAFLLGHKNENMRALGAAMLAAATTAIVETIQAMEHVKTCPKCKLRKQILEALLTEDKPASSEQVPNPWEFV